MRRRNNNFKNFLTLVIIGLIIGAGVFVYFSPQFEKHTPTITFKNTGFWNAKDKLSISAFDESGVKSYSVYYKTADSEVQVLSNSISNKQSTVVFDVQAFALDPEVKNIKLAVEVYDNSLWNFFQGNRAYEEFELKIDRKKPFAKVVSNSRTIKRGGSATVVVQVADENISNQYITFNDKYKFELFPFQKKGFYAAVIAWPIDIEFDDFERVNLVAVDKANNKTIKKVPLYIKDLKIKVDKLNISKNFVNKVSAPVLQKSDYEVPDDNIEIFLKSNRDLRSDNVNTIRKESLKNMSRDMIKTFKMQPFKRLARSKTFAGFAEKRKYYYNKEKVDEAWHLGMDWASVKNAPIKISNSGQVIYEDFLGIYGNTLIIDHKLGIQSLYAHTSKFKVQKGDDVMANEIIANTGSTGAVFGDHLHFGILVQGIEVNPLEWLDKSWLNSRVLNVLAEARQEIKSSK